jgi:hypothetical protein
VFGSVGVGGGGESVGEGEYGANTVYIYINGKSIPVETVPGMGGVEIKENDGGVNSSTIYLIYCKSFCYCHNVQPPSTIVKKFFFKRKIIKTVFD